MRSFVLAALATGMATLAGPALAGDADGLSVHDGWMRFIIAARPAGGFFEIANDGDADATLTGASSPACGMVMLHRSMTKDGAGAMMKVESVEVPAHGKLAFAPGGYHLMCMQPREAMKVGGKVPVTLEFAGGATLTSDFAVRGPGG